MSTDVVVWLWECILEALGVAVYPQLLWSFEEVSVLLCTHKSCCLCGRASVYNFPLMSEWTMWPNRKGLKFLLRFKILKYEAGLHFI